MTVFLVFALCMIADIVSSQILSHIDMHFVYLCDKVYDQKDEDNSLLATQVVAKDAGSYPGDASAF